MASLFNLDISTPERKAFSGKVQSVIVQTPNGKMGILAGHEPMVVSLDIGSISIVLEDGERKECVNTEGVAEVSPIGVSVLVQTVEWPEEIDIARAEQEMRTAEEELRQKRSQREYLNVKSSMARAMARLRVTHTHDFD